MDNLTIVARIETEKDSAEFVRNELIKLIEPTRNEEGCLQYDLHQDNEDSCVFVFYENWKSRELWQKHMKNENLAAFGKAAEGMIKTNTVNEMTIIE